MALPTTLKAVDAETASYRFWSKVRKSDGCWEWTGSGPGDGYGSTKIRGRTVLAHRLSWALAYGDIPDGFMVCHHCDNPSCVRPDHLFLGTARDNSRDAVRKRRHPSQQRPTCPNGHLYDTENTYHWPKRPHWRQCRACLRMRDRRRVRRRLAGR